MRSLRTRLLLVSAVVLAGFLGLSGLALDQAFRGSAESALRERLQGHLYALLAAADLNDAGELELPVELPEPRFNLIGSGLFAEIHDDTGKIVWRSPSALGISLNTVTNPSLGERVFRSTSQGDSPERLMLSFATRWEVGGKTAHTYVFHVGERLDEHLAKIQQFRRTLFGWLAAATLLLLVVQALILRWGLAPLRRLAQDLAKMETGRTQTLHGNYPAELQPLVDNLNTLLVNARAHLERYRDALGNLAHSLKTPLAVLRATVESKTPVEELREVSQEQLQNMNNIVEYQLQRAAVAGRTALSIPLLVAPTAQKILSALGKVYGSKSIRAELDISSDVIFRGDEGDLLEILGNLADNAFKWAKAHVCIKAHNESGDKPGPQFTLRVEDDGPGIDPDQVSLVRARGARVDTATPGHGLGLAMVQEVVQLYGGVLEISRSSLGGAAVEVRL